MKSESEILKSQKYVGRIAPTPSGHVHIGHAQTFSIALIRALASTNCELKMRIEDLDFARCKRNFVFEMFEDLHWFGIVWDFNNRLEVAKRIFQLWGFAIGDEFASTPLMPTSSDINPSLKHRKVNDEEKTCFPTIDLLSAHSSPHCSGASVPVSTATPLTEHCVIQSNRKSIYKAAWLRLLRRGYIYPSPQSRKDVERAVSAPHEGDIEIIFPAQFRPDYITHRPYGINSNSHFPKELQNLDSPASVNWRFRVPDGETVSFTDLRCGLQKYTCGIDFGDFLIWRGSDDIPSYELAVVIDDAEAGVTEVVRGEDLLMSTARQLLLYHALEYAAPSFYHCPLIRDDNGRRLAKRSPSQTLRLLRQQEGYTPARIIREHFTEECKHMIQSQLEEIFRLNLWR